MPVLFKQNKGERGKILFRLVSIDGKNTRVIY